MANNGIEEIITTLYEMVQDAWSLPLGNEKCVVERDKVLDLLDEISNQLPGELKQAKTIVESRNEVITNAKREAENILKQAEQRAKQMISREEITRQAAQQADEMVKAAQQKIKELKQVTRRRTPTPGRRRGSFFILLRWPPPRPPVPPMRAAWFRRSAPASRSFCSKPAWTAWKKRLSHTAHRPSPWPGWRLLPR